MLYLVCHAASTKHSAGTQYVITNTRWIICNSIIMMIILRKHNFRKDSFFYVFNVYYVSITEEGSH